MQGWIKLHRQLMESPVWNEPGILKLWIYCLLKATHKEKEVLIGQQLVKLNPGEFITGRKRLFEDFNKGTKPKNNVSEITLFRWLRTLEKMGNVNIKTNNKYSIITVANWEIYQGNGMQDEQDNEHQMNIKCTSNEHQMNTNKNVKNVKNDKEVYRQVQHMKLTAGEFNRLNKLYSKTEIDDILDQMENWKKLKNYVCAYRTANNWLKKKYPNRKEREVLG